MKLLITTVAIIASLVTAARGADQCPATTDFCKNLDGRFDPRQIRDNWHLVFNEDFDGPAGSSVNFTRWDNRKTTAYLYGDPNYADGTRNPYQHKLDAIVPWNVKLDGAGWATFIATEQGQDPYPPDPRYYFWHTGLITTQLFDAEGKWTLPIEKQGFRVKTGDYIETVVQLPTENGAWPCLWTWGLSGVDSRGEVDTFEYFADNPGTLELTSHRYADADQCLFDNGVTIFPGNTARLGTYYGADSITWYLNDCRAHSTPAGRGVGANFESFILMSISVYVGEHHPSPPGPVDRLEFKSNYIKVWSQNPR